MTGVEGKIEGLQRLDAILERAGQQAVPLLTGAIWREANYLMGKSIEHVPVMDGVLRAGAIVLRPEVSGTRIRVRFGYGGAASAYALTVHENPRAGRTGGVSPTGRQYKKWAQVGEWKFLERPVLDNWPGAEGRMAADLQPLFGG